MSAPRALTYALSQFMGDHQTLREACLTYFAQTRAMGEKPDITSTFQRLENLLRRELQQHPEEGLVRSYWKAQYGYVRGILHSSAQGIKQTNPRSQYQVGEQVVVPR